MLLTVLLLPALHVGVADAACATAVGSAVGAAMPGDAGVLLHSGLEVWRCDVCHSGGIPHGGRLGRCCGDISAHHIVGSLGVLF